jgi:uncharacterized membrane protein
MRTILRFFFLRHEALNRLPAAQSIAAMQSINDAVFNPLFATTFFGTTAACLILGIASVFMWRRPAGIYHVAGSLLFLIGTIFVTFAFNVPKNEALAKIEPTNPSNAAVRASYFTGWMFWNHVRGAAAFAAAASLTRALLRS